MCLHQYSLVPYIIRIFHKILIKITFVHLIFLTSLYISSKIECCNESSYVVPKYHLIEKCHRSKLGIAAMANITSWRSCERLAIEKSALAINFSPWDKLNESESLEYTCEVLKCAEIVGGTTLSEDSRFDYYSIYANPLPNVTSICVPAIGMFILESEKLNYTQSLERCKNMSSVLADVSSEQRTEALAQVLVNANIQSAYVGMTRRNDSVFYNNDGESLNCITYRAWAPGHPRRGLNISCVLLTSNRTWKTSLCSNKVQPLCELIPGGPLGRGSIFAFRKQSAVPDKVQKEKIIP